MDKQKVVFLCHLSTQELRDRLSLKSWRIRNVIMDLMHHPKSVYRDFAIWNYDFISEFEKHQDEFEFHIVSPHSGMKESIQEFSLRGIQYHWYKDDGNLLSDFLKAKFDWNKKTNYAKNRKIIASILEKINPRLVVLCGAECISFSIAALDINNIPIYVLLQTVVNNKLKIEKGMGNPYILNIEKSIFLKTNYFGSGVSSYIQDYKTINHNAYCLKISFPSHPPKIYDISKEFDFVFLGRVVPNKGIEDVLKAFSVVVNTFPNATLNVVGPCEDAYKRKLEGIVSDCGISKNVIFSGSFANIDDVHKQVQKSEIAVLPGITAPLNSTVRESMLMAMPTIVYETTATPTINREKECIYVAKMQDIDELAHRMLEAYENKEHREIVAKNGKEYADAHFNNSIIGNRLISNIKAVIDNYYQRIPIPENLLSE